MPTPATVFAACSAAVLFLVAGLRPMSGVASAPDGAPRVPAPAPVPAPASVDPAVPVAPVAPGAPAVGKPALAAPRFPPPEYAGKLLNIAHRGARGYAPENTCDAFVKAARLGCHGVELDVHLTKDGVPVVVHDDDLDRCSDVAARFPDRRPWMVSDFTMAEIATLDAGSWFVLQIDLPADRRQAFLRGLTDAEIRAHITADDRARWTAGKVRHPTLEEALACCKAEGLLVNVELKCLPRMYPGLAAKSVALIKATGMEARVIVSSFDHEAVAEVRALDKRIATGALSVDRIARPVDYLRGLLDADAWHPDAELLGTQAVPGGADAGSAVAKLRAGGVAVNVWTVNDPAVMKRLADAGVGAIITDYPDRLSRVLARTGKAG